MQRCHGYTLYDCPTCETPDSLVYRINVDAYVCRGCDAAFDVLSTEDDHVLYNGGPPQSVGTYRNGSIEWQ
jgi:hypothetical protein